MFREEQTQECCPINHLAQALYFDAWQERGFVVATTVYADASGSDHDQPLLLVAGWFNSVRYWTEFGAEWKAFLTRRGIKCLHQTGNSKDDEWRKTQTTRDAVLQEAFEIIQRSGAVSFTHFTPTVDFDAWLSKAPKGYQRPNGFAWNAFRFVVDIEGYCSDRHMPMPEFVFESCGKADQGELIGVMERFGLPQPIFRDKLATDPERTVVALQAAYFLAHELFRGWKDLIAERETVRPFLKQFETIEHQWHWGSEEKLNSIIQVSHDSYDRA